MNKLYYLYTITDVLNNKIYVGQTVNPSRRWNDHKWLSQNKQEQYIHHAMAKYGIENFEFEVIATCRTPVDADFTEIQLIDQFNSRNKLHGYNVAPGGNVTWKSGLPSHMYPMFGKHHSEETKQKISQSNFGKKNPHSKEWSEKMSKIMTDRQLTDEWKEKISISNKNTNVGRIHTEESKNKMSKSKMGHVISTETKQKISKANMKWTEEQYQMMIILYQSGLSAAKVGKKMNCDAKTVFNTLKKFNVKIRSISESAVARNKL